jgi:hypothetical protein
MQAGVNIYEKKLKDILSIMSATVHTFINLFMVMITDLCLYYVSHIIQ